jgi:alkylation response protein AidB-like acyl-CoA dehydrogenase
VLQRRLAQFDAELMALEFTGLRMLSANQRARVPGVEASVLKVRGTELRQSIFELLVDIAGPQAIPFEDGAMTLAGADDFAAGPGLASLAANYLDARKLSIYGGANEVQRNLIARAVLA